MGSLRRLFTMKGWREGSVTGHQKRLWALRVRRVTTSSFCLFLASSIASCVLLIQHRLVWIGWPRYGISEAKHSRLALAFCLYVISILGCYLHCCTVFEGQGVRRQAPNSTSALFSAVAGEKTLPVLFASALSAKKRIDSCMGMHF